MSIYLEVLIDGIVVSKHLDDGFESFDFDDGFDERNELLQILQGGERRNEGDGNHVEHN